VSKEDPTKLYLKPKKIGEGAAGEVFLATSVATREDVAIKKMTLNAQNIKLLTAEIHIMKESHHPNVVRYFDSFRVEDKLWVAMEYMGGGCLTEILEQFEHVHMREEHIAWVCQETLRGLEYIHSLHRIHRYTPTLPYLTHVAFLAFHSPHTHTHHRTRTRHDTTRAEISSRTIF